MAVNAHKPVYEERELVPEGTYIARCYRVIDIGTAENDYKGEIKKAHKVRISWELPTELRVFKEELGEQPMSVDNEYTLSLGDKATLRSHLQSWRGKAFTPKELEAFDILKLLGAPCMLTITHKPGVKDPTKKYVQLSSVSALPKGFDCPDQINPSFFFEHESFDVDKFNSLPQFLRDKIALSDEYLNRSNNIETVAETVSPLLTDESGLVF